MQTQTHHGNASVLELGGAVPTERLVTSRLAQVERVIFAKGGRVAADILEGEGDLGARALWRRDVIESK